MEEMEPLLLRGRLLPHSHSRQLSELPHIIGKPDVSTRSHLCSPVQEKKIRADALEDDPKAFARRVDDLLRRVRAVSEEQRELDRHSFVIKLWVEEVISGQTKWRGHITHVSTAERRYVERLE